jgi:tRNA (guanosine-2'-O-)-methyltransferase
MQVLATSFSEAAVPFRNWDFTRPTAVMLGNEHSGVDKELLALADGEICIPMYGMIQSFNVSVAAAIILAEAVRQREAAGMYDAPRMDEATLATKLADWLRK